jgi:hypothetical protein
MRSIEEQTDETAIDPDKVVTSVRSATLADGLFTVQELSDFFSRLPRLRSAYDEGLGLIGDTGGLSTFGDRVKLLATRKGRNEPEYTSYTHYWKTVLGELRLFIPLDVRLINLNLKITFSFWIQSTLIQRSRAFSLHTSKRILYMAFHKRVSAVVTMSLWQLRYPGQRTSSIT